MPTTIFLPTWPTNQGTNQNWPMLTIFNFCVFHPIWMKFEGKCKITNNRPSLKCLQLINSIFRREPFLKNLWSNWTLQWVKFQPTRSCLRAYNKAHDANDASSWWHDYRIMLISLVFDESVTDQPTDRPTDRPTDGRTDRPGYRDARTHLKKGF